MDDLLTIQIPYKQGPNKPFYYRDTVADRGVIKQIFEREDYAFRRLRRREELLAAYRAIVASGRRPLIIDAGANIGASVVWFQGRFPASHIVAFEPDAANFELLRRNADFPQADLRLAAIGSYDGRANIANPEDTAWAFRAEPAEDGTCELTSMTRIVDEKIAEGCAPFIVKIDIEGGEDNLFAASTEWVSKFPVLIIELHDWLYPSEGKSLNFLKTIAALNRDFVHINENIFSLANSG